MFTKLQSHRSVYRAKQNNLNRHALWRHIILVNLSYTKHRHKCISLENVMSNEIQKLGTFPFVALLPYPHPHPLIRMHSIPASTVHFYSNCYNFLQLNYMFINTECHLLVWAGQRLQGNYNEPFKSNVMLQGYIETRITFIPFYGGNSGQSESSLHGGIIEEM